LAPDDQGVFLSAGFEPIDELCLLERDLSRLPPVPDIDIRTRRYRLDDVIAVDHAAFPAFWHLTSSGLSEARRATPTSRLRVVGSRPCQAYALVGRAGHLGYLQRLAVHPDRANSGIGRALVVDGLDWLATKGATRIMVNTQVTNQRALGLYESLGFTRLPEGLTVLALDLTITVP